MSPFILCIGTTPVLQRSMTFDRVTIDAVNRAKEVSDYASGKSINVARVLHTLGEDALATGFLGGDSGKFIRNDLAACGVAHDFLTVTPATRMCITVIDRSTNHATELVEESKEVEKPAWAKLRTRVAELLPKAKLMVLSGSLTPGAPQDFYAWCINRAHDSAIHSILDAAGEPLNRALASRPLVVKPNRSELARSLDTPIESDAAFRDAIKQLIALGPQWAIVTAGADPVTVSDGDHFWRITPPRVNAISPIGSGDALAAGIASALSRGQKLPDAARLGVACGVANAMTDRAGHLHADEVAQILEQARLEEW